MRKTVYKRYIRACLLLTGLSVTQGCLLLVTAPEIGLLEDRSVVAGEELTVPIVVDGQGRDLTLTYRIDGGGWEPVDGSTFAYTFDEPGEYVVTITASNGLRFAETSFTVTVTAS